MPLFAGRPARFEKRRFRPAFETLEERTVPTLLGQQLFPADHAWNQRITDAPVAANSAAIMSNIVNTYGNNRLHPDFGEQYGTHRDLYGIPYNIVHGNSTPKVSVVIDSYPSESDRIPAPIPANVVIEGDFQDGPRVGLNNRGDSHLLIWDVDNNIAYEFYRASRPSENADGKWHAAQQTVWDMKTNNFRTLGWTSADAAGLSVLAGLVRPDEALPVSQGGQGVINHAIRFTLQNAVILDQFIYPASHTANPGNNNASIQPAMGERFRLKASVDISQLNPQSRVIAQAMKDYGLIVADNGSNFFFQGASFSVNASNQQTLTFDDDDVQDSTRGLKSLRFDMFEVVDLTPRVTDLSVHSGSAGTQVTVVGQNFAGAGGQLHVWFGSQEATSVTYVDDGHLSVLVPSGTGTVNVRVQSGRTTNHPENHTGTIFGYGTSAVNPAATFTYGSTPVNQAPTVAQAAGATPGSGMTRQLSVLGADDGGEAALIYTWSLLSKPSGAADPSFSVNGTNAAKNTAATFSTAGSYTLRVSMVDGGGLSATSQVTVSVVTSPGNQAPTVAQPASATPLTSTTAQLSALGADDGGEAGLIYTWTLLSKPSGAADPLFSLNGTNAAKNTVATFAKAGTYTFRVTTVDGGGLSAASEVTVTVAPILSSITVTPGVATMRIGTARRFRAVARDQFGDVLAVQPKFTWRLRGAGKVSPHGRYLAPWHAGGPYRLMAYAGTIRGVARVYVVN
jgi:hypothetical protein